MVFSFTASVELFEVFVCCFTTPVTGTTVLVSLNWVNGISSVTVVGLLTAALPLVEVSVCCFSEAVTGTTRVDDDSGKTDVVSPSFRPSDCLVDVSMLFVVVMFNNDETVVLVSTKLVESLFTAKVLAGVENCVVISCRVVDA